MNSKEEALSWEFEYLNRMINGNPKAGQIVKTKTGLEGVIYNSESPLNGKVKVHCDNTKLLCDPTTLTLIGYI
jgi:hypothetical protein